MHYKVEDFPAGYMEFDGLDIDPSYSGVRVLFMDPYGNRSADPVYAYIPFDDDRVARVPFGGESTALSVEGIYTVQPYAVTSASPEEPFQNTEPLPPQYIAVEAMASQGWHTIDSARSAWPGAPVDDVMLFRLLQVARIECEAYAPVSAPVTENFRAAQIAQARDVANSISASPGGDGGPDTFILPAVGMRWAVMQLLRPKRVVGSIG